MEIAYIAITVISTGVLVFMLLAGIGHDVEVGSADIEADLDIDVDADIDAGGGPAVLSIKLLLLFLVGFGIVGYFALSNGWNPLGSGVDHLFFAAVGGVISYIALYQLLKLLYRQQASSQITATSLAGRQARVTSAIEAGHTGEVIVQDAKTGQSIYLRAQAQDGEHEYKKGENATVVSVANGLAIIK